MTTKPIAVWCVVDIFSDHIYVSSVSTISSAESIRMFLAHYNKDGWKDWQYWQDCGADCRKFNLIETEGEGQ